MQKVCSTQQMARWSRVCLIAAAHRVCVWAGLPGCRGYTGEQHLRPSMLPCSMICSQCACQVVNAAGEVPRKISSIHVCAHTAAGRYTCKVTGNPAGAHRRSL